MFERLAQGHIICLKALPLHSGPSRSPTLGSAVASSSHCQPVGPEELQARSRPLASPPEVHTSQRRAHPNPVENDQQRARASTGRTERWRNVAPTRSWTFTLTLHCLHMVIGALLEGACKMFADTADVNNPRNLEMHKQVGLFLFFSKK